MAREMRKYFSGVVFATQLITDNLKGDQASSEEKAVQDLFDLATYRFVGKQTATCIPVLEGKFPGMYTETELYRIPSLDMGSFIGRRPKFRGTHFHYRNRRPQVRRRTVNES